MLLYLNMNCRATIGNVILGNVTSFEINENLEQISNTGNIVVPKNWKSLQGVPIVKNIKVGDAVVIEAGYNGDYYYA